jgi:hypothetical protein
VHLEQYSQAQLLSFNILSVDGRKVEDLAFSVQFRQTAPVSISYIDGPKTKLRWVSGPDSPDNRHANLEDELAELEMLKEQLRTLEHSIALKVVHISETFSIDQPEELLQDADCDGLRCLIRKYYRSLKGTASKMYHGGQKENERHHWLPSHHDNQLASTLPRFRGGQHPLTDSTDSGRNSDNLPSPHQSEYTNSLSTSNHILSIPNEGADSEFVRPVYVMKPQGQLLTNSSTGLYV